MAPHTSSAYFSNHTVWCLDIKRYEAQIWTETGYEILIIWIHGRYKTWIIQSLLKNKITYANTLREGNLHQIKAFIYTVERKCVKDKNLKSSIRDFFNITPAFNISSLSTSASNYTPLTMLTVSNIYRVHQFKAWVRLERVHTLSSATWFRVPQLYNVRCM